MRGFSWLTVAVFAGLAATVAVGMIELAGAGSQPPTPSDLVPLLIAAAGLCVVGLSVRRSRSVAWVSVVAVLSIVTLVLVAWMRANRTAIDPIEWRWLAVAVCLGTILSTGSSARYASEPQRRLAGWVPVVSIVAVAMTGLVCGWVLATLDETAAASPESPIGDLGVVTRTLLLVVVGLTCLGIMGDLRPAARRTRRRLDAVDASAAGDPGDMSAALRAARIFVDEISPGRVRAKRAADVERSRIAAELHADVIPVVRRALREAEGGGSPERFALALRDVLAEVDALVADRQSVTLEAFGLLAALEWLAERTEDRSDVRVRIDVSANDGADGTGPDDGRARPPRPVEAAAFRIAQLALENVVRHAPAASTVIELSAAARRVHLVVSDDGPGLPPDAGRAATSSGRRGLADMRAAAVDCGASLVTAIAPGGRGTVVDFAWPAEG
ncbi:MAG TPA: ATP-binding protein [Candidatus Limnocylindrales bacterium]|nr:ATP-binding protein [Candidatus Limnocylindrales bacterium]